MKHIFHNKPNIYTTGAFLQPARIVDNAGKEIWIWYVSEFTDDSFLDGNVYNPQEVANSKEELILGKRRY